MTTDPQQTRRHKLIELLRELSVRTGIFTLASGKTSDLYIDARQTTLHAEGSLLAAHLLLNQLNDDVMGVGGLTMGADPLVCSAAAHSLAVLGRPIHGFLIRKEEKGHGTGRFVEGTGNLPANSHVCIVEDTTTTGQSLLTAAERATAAGLQVVQCITLVDRDEGATDMLAAAGYRLEALVRRSELVDS
jgi:orotate phosphoribosyltransferase